MIKLILIVFSILISCETFGFESKIAILYIDQKTEEKIGIFPIKRNYYADVIKTLNEFYKAKIIVVKIFLDLPKPEDKLLISSIKTYSNLYTQALATNEKESCKANLNLKDLGNNSLALHDFNCGWIPNKQMSEAFRNIGMVNGIMSKEKFVTGLSLVNSINGKLYPSLPLLIASHIKSLSISVKENQVYLGNKKLILKNEASYPIDSIPEKSPFPTYSFIDVLNKKINKVDLIDKMVFIFYRGEKTPSLKISKDKKANQAEIIAWVTDSLIKL